MKRASARGRGHGGQGVAIAWAVALATLLALAGPARADTVYARVLTDHANVRTGPGATYRVLYVAERGESLPVIARGSKDFWFKVGLPDGRKGWILGDQTAPYELVDKSNPGIFTRMGRAISRTFLGPSPIQTADVGIAFSAGIVGGEGAFLVRPSYVVHPRFALEAYGGEVVGAQGTILLYGLGWTLRLWPEGPLVPYLNVSGGAATTFAKSDAFVLGEQTLLTTSGGGGVELTFKKRITGRFDFREYVLFDGTLAINLEEFTGGLAIFF